MKHKKNIKLAVKLIVTSLLLYFVFSKIDISLLKNRLYDVNVFMLLFVVFIGFINLVLSVYRWWLLQSKLYKIDISFIDSFKLYSIGTFFNLFLPTGFGGDGVKLYLNYKYTGKKGSIHSIIVDRFIGICTLFCIGLLSIFVGKLLSLYIPLKIVALFLSFTLFFIIFFLVAFFVKAKIIQDFTKDFILLFQSKKILYQALLISIVFHIFVILNSYLVSLSYGFELNILYFFIFIPIITVIANIPITISGLGLKEMAFLILFGAIGLNDGTIILIPLTMFMVLILLGSIGGVIYILEKKFT